MLVCMCLHREEGPFSLWKLSVFGKGEPIMALILEKRGLALVPFLCQIYATTFSVSNRVVSGRCWPVTCALYYRSGVYTDISFHTCLLCGLGLRYGPKQRPTSYKAMIDDNLSSSIYGRDNVLEKSISFSLVGHFSHVWYKAAMFIVVSLFNHRYILNSWYLRKNQCRENNVSGILKWCFIVQVDCSSQWCLPLWHSGASMGSKQGLIVLAISLELWWIGPLCRECANPALMKQKIWGRNTTGQHCGFHSRQDALSPKIRSFSGLVLKLVPWL